MMENSLEQINNSALKFLEPLTLEETYKIVVHEALKIFGAYNGSILIADEKGLKRVYASDLSLFEVKVRSNGFTYNVFKTNKTQIFTEERLRKVHPGLIKMKIKSVIAIPLSYKKESVGVLTLQFRHEEELKKQDLMKFKLFGSLATLSIRKMQLYEEVQETVQLRDLFISMVAHELRTPLTSINGFIGLIDGRMKKNMTIDKSWVDFLVSESKVLTRMVVELLEINHIRTGKLKFASTKDYLTEVINKAVVQFQNVFPTHKVKFVNTIPEQKDIVFGDQKRLLQMVNNILENAGNYSPENSVVTITLDRKQKTAILTITDQGKGIAPKDLPHVFDVFYKSEDNFKKGMGLGLYMARIIAEKHKGSIAVFSQLEKGTTIQITLPLATK